MIDDFQDIWHLALSELSTTLNKPSFETWFNLSKPVAIDNSCLIIEVPNDFTREWFETRYREQIIQALQKTSGHTFTLKFIVASEIAEESKDIQTTFPLKVASSDHADRKVSSINMDDTAIFNPRYTFDTFVVGACNRLSHAASLAVAESPARAYNPLFIYGGVGLGKTHLLHAIGQYALINHSFSKISYFSSERFTNEFINSIRDNKTLDFRNKYRSIDILLIDDVQFFAGKEQTQEEFFHTFNALHDNNKQLIISSDRPPKEIPTIEDRLRSRFEWGLITDLQPPDLETRIAILKKKAVSDGIDIPEQVIQYIATKVISNIRELEGALIRIIAFASLSETPITYEITEKALHDIIFTRQKNISVSMIIKQTAEHFDLSPEAMLSKKRTQNIAQARHVAMYLSRMLTDLSLPKIGEEFGGRDHTTVLHACKKIDSLLSNNHDYKQRVEILKNIILDNS